MGKTIGIDLGTTNSACAYLNNGKPIIIPNAIGNRVTPSVVAFGNKDEITVGESALNQLIHNSERTVKEVKRLMGDDSEITINGRKYRPEIISSYILKKIKEDAEKFLGCRIKEAVITVPAYFSDAQRQATKDAGKLAGLKVMRIINEPTAAALAYGLDRKEEETVLVYDLGGGTFDVSILELENGIFEVKATRGNNRLGGMDFDACLSDVIIKEFKHSTGIDLTADKLAFQKVREEVEKAKKMLSSESAVEINIPFISADASGPKHLACDITRSEFEALIEGYIDETITLTEQALEDAGLEGHDIDHILLVGGSTRIPLITEKLEKRLGRKIISGIHPEEVVACGAAVQTGIIDGEVSDVVLVDVTPLSLGIEIDGGVFVPIINRNTPIPVEAKKIFTTISDNQEEVEVHILQGERKRISENISLGKFILSGIRPAKKGVPRIEVKFDIDVDSIVHVSAKDKDTGCEQTITVTSQSGLDDSEIQKLIRDAEKKKLEDETYVNFVSAKNEARGLLMRMDRLLTEVAIPDSFKEEIEDVYVHLHKAIDEEDVAILEENCRILESFVEELYSRKESLKEDEVEVGK